MGGATNTAYRPTRRSRENIRNVLCRLGVKMVREKQLGKGHLRHRFNELALYRSRWVWGP